MRIIIYGPTRTAFNHWSDVIAECADYSLRVSRIPVNRYHFTEYNKKRLDKINDQN
jgi:hypothetical protein